MTRILQTNAIYKIVVILIAVGALFGVLFLRSRQEVERQPTLIVGSEVVPITIADTAPLREQGLSGTMSLAPGSGKFFIFDQSDRYGFWMKDMRYALDIVWINDQKQVIAVDADISPETYPQVFYPPVAVLYVLEVNTGDAEKLGLTIGATIGFSKNN